MTGTPSAIVPVAPTAATRLSKRGASEQLLDALRRLWSRTKTPQRDEHVQSIAKGLFTSRRFRGIEHVVEIQFDALDREAPIEVAEEFWQRGLAITRAKFAERRGVRVDGPATLGELLQAERHAHADREMALAVFLSEKTYTSAVKLFEAASAYDRANALLMDYSRRRAAECQGPKLALSRSR